MLHEFELGVWKTLFTHLICLLHAISAPGDLQVVELDKRQAVFDIHLIHTSSLLLRRYRQISTFGNGTIRRFATNASEMKKLAARDYEDLLQVHPSQLHVPIHKFHRFAVFHTCI